jgi:hypothetical protein
MMHVSGSLINFDQFSDTESVKNKALRNAAIGGANSGFEIEGADFFKNPELANEFPEMKDDIELIVSTEAFVHRLVNFRHRVIEQRGMSRGMAHELLDLVPSLESHTSPMHFTEQVSSINSTWSLEQIDVKLWALIAAAVAFVLTLIYKFINWLTGSSDGESSSGPTKAEASTKLKEAERSMDQQVQAATQMHQVMKDAKGKTMTLSIPAVTDHGLIGRSHLPQVLKDTVTSQTQDIGSSVSTGGEEAKVEIGFNLYDILSTIDEGKTVYDYIVNPNQYARIIYGSRTEALDLVTGSFNAFHDVAPLVLNKIDLLDQMVKDLKEARDNKTDGNEQVALKFKADLDAISKSPLMGEKYKIGKTDVTSLPQWATELRTAVMDTSNYRGKFTDLDEMIEAVRLGTRRLKDVQWTSMAALFEVIARAKDSLVVAGQQVKQIQGLSTNVQQNDEMETRSTNIMKMIREVQADVSALMSVYSTISKVYREVSVNGAKVLGVVRHNAKAIVSFYQRFNLDAPSDLEMILQDIEEAAEQMQSYQQSQRVAVISVNDLRTTVSIGVAGTDAHDRVLDADERQTLSNLGIGPKT